MPEEQLCPHQVPGPGAVPHAAQGQAGGSHCLLRWCVASLPVPCPRGLGLGLKHRREAGDCTLGPFREG